MSLSKYSQHLVANIKLGIGVRDGVDRVARAVGNHGGVNLIGRRCESVSEPV